ncbi:MAG: transposase [Micropruina sp.]
MVEGRSKQALKTWLAERPAGVARQHRGGRDGGVHRFKTATVEELPEAATVLDPFHVVRLAGDALDECRRRIQQAIQGHRGRTTDPLYAARRTLATGADLLTEKKTRLHALFADDAHVEVEATWGIYQRMIAAHRHPDRHHGHALMVKLIVSVSTGVPIALVEVIKLGRTLTKRNADVLAYFDHPRGPATAPPKPSTDVSNTSAVSPSASGT